ncbi:MAG: hypothetical protein QGI88_09045, partial [SAR202 cluster bacterium]|nr:hypothetical protein [SAR202 cluster bacterium]
MIEHYQDEHPNAVDDTPQVNIDYPVPIGGARFPDSVGQYHARVVEQHVHGAVFDHRPVRQPLDVRRARHIGFNAD